MAKKREGTAPQTTVDALQRQLNTLQKQINTMKQTGPSSIQPDDWEDALSPTPWEVMTHWPGHHPEATPHDNLVYFHPGYVDAETGGILVTKGWKAFNDRRVKNIKIHADTRANKVNADGAFRYPIEEDLHKTKISYILGFAGVAGTGTTTMRLRNVTRGITIATFTLDQTDGTHAWSSPVTINDGGDPLEPNHMVFELDWFHVDLTTVAAGSKGAGIYVKHS